MRLTRTIFRLIISLYSAPYRKHFGQSLLQTFDDMREEEPGSDWFIIRDAAASIPMQYANYFEETMKTKFKNVPAAVAGAALVFPFAALIAISVSARALQNLGFKNSWSAGIAAILGPRLELGMAIVFFFPLAAFLINLVALIWVGFRERGLSVKQFAAGNILSIVVMLVGLAFAAFVPLHDAIPCAINGILRNGFHDIVPLIRACRNA